MAEIILTGDALEQLRHLPPESVHTCVTSPPYYNLRDYGAAGQIGNEASVEEYLQSLVSVFREVRRVLRADGTLWVNMGDSYATRSIPLPPDGRRQLGGRQVQVSQHAAQLGGDVGEHNGEVKLLCFHRRILSAGILSCSIYGEGLSNRGKACLEHQ